MPKTEEFIINDTLEIGVQDVSAISSVLTEDAGNRNYYLEEVDFTDTLTQEDELYEKTPYYVKLKASHLGYTNQNGYNYDVNAVKRAIYTWTSPYNKPVHLLHDTYSDPIGRVVSAKVINIQEADPKDILTPKAYVELIIRVSDETAKEKIEDERYLTVSVGSVPKHIYCSICNEEITIDNVYEHEHKRNETYDKQRCYWNIHPLKYKEVSFVHAPADESKFHYAGVSEKGVKFSEKLGMKIKTKKDEEENDSTSVNISDNIGGSMANDQKPDLNNEDVIKDFEQQITDLKNSIQDFEEQIKTKDVRIQELETKVEDFVKIQKEEIIEKIISEKSTRNSKDVEADDAKTKLKEDYLKFSVEVLDEILKSVQSIEIVTPAPVVDQNNVSGGNTEEINENEAKKGQSNIKDEVANDINKLGKK